MTSLGTSLKIDSYLRELTLSIDININLSFLSELGKKALKNRFAPKEEIRDSYRKGLQEENPLFLAFGRKRNGIRAPLSLRTEENNHTNEETRRGTLIRAGSNTASAAY